MRVSHRWRVGAFLLVGYALVGDALATPSFRDSLSIENGESYPIFYAKEEDARNFPWSPELRKIALSDGLNCSAGGTPAARYALRGGVMWLVGFDRCSGEVSLAAAYGKPTEPLRASWISGRLHIGQGKLMCSDPYGTSVWERRMELVVVQGRASAEHIHQERTTPATNVPKSDNDPCAAWRR